MINNINNLPKSIKTKFDILYSEYKGNGIIIFKTNNGFWGVLKEVSKWGIFDSLIKVVDSVYDCTIYYEEKSLFEGVNFKEGYSEYSFFDMNGKFINKLKARCIDIVKGNIIIKDTNGKTGLLNDKLNVVLPAIYDKLHAINECSLIFNLNGLEGIINKKGDVLIKAENLNILYPVDGDVIIAEKEKGKYLQYTVDGYFIEELPYSHIFFARSNTYGAKNEEAYYKTIINGIEYDNFDKYDFDCLCKGRWGILNSKGDVQIPNIYGYIDLFRDSKYFKVSKESFKIDEYHELFFAVKNCKFGVVDDSNTIIIPIEFDWIEEISSELWAVNNGGCLYYNSDYQEEYWTVKGGKWGVLDKNNKIIVPIKYDCIRLTWYRIRDYIFVQDGTEKYFDEQLGYDVYDLKGNQIKDNKPNPKEHTFYQNS